MLYTYKAKVISVYDGDTVTCEVDLGFEIKMTIKVRLYGIDTPELRGEEREAGLVVRDIVREMILDRYVILKTMKDKTGKYGRYLGNIHISDTSHIPSLISESTVDDNGFLNFAFRNSNVQINNNKEASFFLLPF